MSQATPAWLSLVRCDGRAAEYANGLRPRSAVRKPSATRPRGRELLYDAPSKQLYSRLPAQLLTNR